MRATRPHDRRHVPWAARPPASVDLYWLPLGAGGHVVRRCGRLYEALAATLRGRTPMDLYHAALQVLIDGRSVVIEQAPVPDPRGDRRGVVAEGPVFLRTAGRLRVFRYEVRRWEGGVIPDVGEAVDSPRRLTDDPALAARLLDTVGDVPVFVWGRDEVGAGEMWNSNSIIAWTLARTGIPTDGIAPPPGGRAPGWHAGLLAAGTAPAS